MSTFPKFLLVAGVSLLIGYLSTACSTIFTGVRQKIEVTSEPSGATVMVDGLPEGATPCKVRVAKGKSHQFTFQKDDYHSAEFMLSNRKLHWTVWLNLLNGELGWFIDAATGSARHFTQKQIHQNLVAQPQEIEGSKPTKCTAVNFKMKRGDILGRMLKNGKAKGGIGWETDIFISEDQLKSIVDERLKDTGFTIAESNDNTVVAIEPTVTKIEVVTTKINNSNYYSEATVVVDWVVKRDGAEVVRKSIEGKGSWGSEGASAIEKAFENSLLSFLLSPELYQNAL